MKLINAVKGLEYDGDIDENIEIKGVAYDSRKVEEGYIFVAIKGFKVDGHDFVDQAIKKGAALIVVEREIGLDINFIKVESSRISLALISRNYYEDPTRSINLIGVTGTNGKTSITYIVRDMLTSMNFESGLIGTIQNCIGNEIVETDSTTPESLQLNEMFSKMKNKNIKHAVMEVSSHALSLSRVHALDFDIATFTNLTQDHLDYHENMNNYFNEKRKLFEIAKKNLINIDDEYGEKLYNEYKEKSYSYSIKKDADFSASSIEMSSIGTSFVLTYQNSRHLISTPFYGDIYVLNVIAAIGSLVALGMNMDDVGKAAESIKPVQGRLERVQNDLGINILVDYAHTPDALNNVLTIGKSFTKGRLISVFGCGGDRDKTKRPKMGRISEEIADFTIVTSDNPRTEDPEMIIKDILTGIQENSNRYTVISDRKIAIEKSIEIAKPGDTIIIAGKGHETYQIIGTVKSHFSDVEVALEYIKG
ncbi:MAG: UDP-N-acetylmuramoyl-L-alanyl-D-glutamate--2,6-diaminopimelate ligase [Bacillota bacterium]|nr:UDP-N-acetylmuramoyl-L-alanyl-D-glutamate--2,6-diaminopimelate ligase [Bacillota bacterium]